MSVGAMSAIGGVYVPVNDAAVTLNSGTLVYKECVLDGVVKRMAENQTSALVYQGVRSFMSGRTTYDAQGNQVSGPRFSQNIANEQLYEVSDPTMLRLLQDGTFDSLNPAFRETVKRNLARGYMTATRKPTNELECPYAGDLTSVLNGNPDGTVWSAISALRNPACVPFSAQRLALDYADETIAANIEDMMTKLNWGDGIYSIEETDANGNTIVREPGTLVKNSIEQLLTSGFRQLENANEIDQMVGELFSGISTQLISDNRGLQGLTQAAAGQPSYLDRVVSQSAQGVREGVVNAALQILAAAKQVEATYLQIMQAIAARLDGTLTELRAKESACWTLVVPAVRNFASQNSITLDNNRINAATSSFAFSMAVINAQVGPLASTTVTNVGTSQRANQILDQLIANVTNSTDPNIQTNALRQLDQLVAQSALHSQYDLQQAQQTQLSVNTSMTSLITDSVTAWADSTDPNIGWCNINNPAVIQMWANRWTTATS